jgi:hypothetical protein
MQKFQDVVLDSQGRPVPGAVIAVQSFPGGSPATVYQTNAVGAAYVPTTDSLGGFFFYAPNGSYSYTVTVAGVLRATVTDIQLQDLVPDPVFAGVITADGIKFPSVHVPSADVNVLDDYEEGVFTPSVVGGTLPGVGTYDPPPAGFYTKIGNRVFYEIQLTWIAHTGTGGMSVSGLPFPVNVGLFPACAVWNQNISMTAGHVMQATANIGSTNILLSSIPTGGGLSVNIPMDAAGSILLSGHYRI